MGAVELRIAEPRRLDQTAPRFRGLVREIFICDIPGMTRASAVEEEVVGMCSEGRPAKAQDRIVES